MAATYDLIESVELTGIGSTATFLSIPSTYTDLVISGQLTINTTASDLYLRFNNDTGANYYGQGAGSNQTPQFRAGAVGPTGAVWLIGLLNSQVQSTNPNFFEVHVNEYANTSYTKNIVQNWGYVADTATRANVGFGAFQWRNTSAINRVDISSTSGGAITGRISLYGILAGNA